MHMWLLFSLTGKPGLTPRLTLLTTSCLEEHKDFLYDELEPIVVCDHLFEEGAVNILAHDFITETKERQKQIKRLIEKVKENKNDCFHFFLYILKNNEYENIRNELENSPLEAVREGMSDYWHNLNDDSQVKREIHGSEFCVWYFKFVSKCCYMHNKLFNWIMINILK